MSVSHYENFPVASVLCPPSLRAPVAAIYWFARTADDIADEGPDLAPARLATLEAYHADLRATHSGLPCSSRWPHVFLPLRRAIVEHDLPLRPLEDLLLAFRQDCQNPAYETRAQLLDYCRLSANPVGRLLLHLYGIGSTQVASRSDQVCTALQLINFWQDLGVDASRGRVYVPRSDLVRHQLDASDLTAAGGPAPVRAMMAELCHWARDLMLDGSGIAFDVPGRAGWELRLVVQGGLRVLDRIEAIGFDTTRRRPRLGLLDLSWMLWHALTMRRPAAGPAPADNQAS